MMVAHGLQAQIEQGSDFLAIHSAREQPQDLRLARAEITDDI
jgi:hypothetical protein